MYLFTNNNTRKIENNYLIWRQQILAAVKVIGLKDISMERKSVHRPSSMVLGMKKVILILIFWLGIDKTNCYLHFLRAF
ncbi:hypothetical protein ACS0TY_009569 [Phlomoides rotata]